MSIRPYLSLALGTLLLFVAGRVSAQTQYPFQNPDLPLEERVNNVISVMTLDEKIAFPSSRPGVPRLGIRTMGHSEGLHGMAQGGPSNWGRRNPAPTTQFPQAYGMGETWDPELMRQAGTLRVFIRLGLLDPTNTVPYASIGAADEPEPCTMDKHKALARLVTQKSIVKHLSSKVERPIKALRGFRRIALKPGESKTVEIPLSAQSLAFWDEGRHAFVVEPGKVECSVGGSSADERLKKTIALQ